VAAQDIDELRKFIELGRAQASSDARDAGIAPDGEARAMVDDRHRPELPDVEGAEIPSDTFLGEKDRPSRVQPNRDSYDEQQWTTESQYCRAEKNVNDSFHGNHLDGTAQISAENATLFESDWVRIARVASMTRCWSASVILGYRGRLTTVSKARVALGKSPGER
jgi:hypothetical protein